jgi:hypothetical protein
MRHDRFSRASASAATTVTAMIAAAAMLDAGFVTRRVMSGAFGLCPLASARLILHLRDVAAALVCDGRTSRYARSLISTAAMTTVICRLCFSFARGVIVVVYSAIAAMLEAIRPDVIRVRRSRRRRYRRWGSLRQGGGGR